MKRKVNQRAGFSMIEMVTVVVVMGVLVSVAIPSYKGYLEHSKQYESDSIALEFQQAAYVIMTSTRGINSYVYPLQSSTKDTIDDATDTIADDKYRSFMNWILAETTIPYKKVKSNTIIHTPAAITYNGGKGIAKFYVGFEGGMALEMVFVVIDNRTLSYDTATLESFTYYHTNGYQSTFMM